eukprot:GILJ01005738.1.p1 GENE.GILJ01005738.1~~GILJ01005738.1.p1  ORF type:complete len:779 (+),score=141.39 GILJ01005738.1:83-2338(+)
MVGSSAADKPSNILVSINGEGYKLFNIETQQCLTSWPVRPNTQITAAAIYNETTKRCIACHDDSTLLFWEVEAPNLTAAAQLQIEGTVHSMHNHHSLNGIILIVTKEGGLVLVNTKTASVVSSHRAPKAKKSKGSTVLSVSIVEENSHLFAIVFQLPLTLSTFKIAPTSITPLISESIQSAAQEETVSVVSASVSQSYLSVLWSNQILETFEFSSFDALPVSKHTRTVTASGATHQMLNIGSYSVLCSTPRKSPLGNEKKTKKQSKAQSSTDEMSETVRAVVSVWDLKYGTLQSTVNVTSDSDEGKLLKGSSEVVSLCRSKDNGFVIVTLLNEVYACSVFLPSSPSLASILGRLSSSNQDESSAPVTLDVESTLSRLTMDSAVNGLLEVSTVSLEKEWTLGLETEKENEASVLQSLLTASDEKSFMKTFKRYAEKQNASTTEESKSTQAVSASADLTPVPANASEGDKRRFQKQKAQKKQEQKLLREARLAKKRQHNLSAYFIGRAMDESLEKGYWGAVSTLLLTDCVSSQSNAQLIPILIENRQLSLLEMVLTHVHDIDESNLVKLLRFFLSGMETSLAEEHIKGKAKEREADPMTIGGIQLEGDTANEAFLYLVLSAPRNDVFLHTALSSLTLQETKVLLSYLRKWIIRFSKKHDKQIKLQNKNRHKQRLPSFAQIIDWVSIVMDSHFTELILVPDFKPLLLDIQRLIAYQIRYCESIEGLKGCMSHFIHRVEMPAAPIPDYSIEMLQL